MQAREWNQRELELGPAPVAVRTFRIDRWYVAEVKSISAGNVISRAAAASRDEAESAAIEIAMRRLSRTPIDPDLTVGG